VSGLGGVFSRSRPRLGGGHVRRFFTRFDWPLFIGIVLLCLIALMNLHSATASSVHAAKYTSQMVWFALGVTLVFGLTIADYNAFNRFAWAGLVTIILMILYVRFFTVAIKGSQRWIDLGFARLQPSELAKIAVILALARLVHLHASGELQPRRMALALGGIATTVGLVAWQPDLGTAIILILIIASVGLIMVRGVPTFVAGLAVSCTATLVLWNFAASFSPGVLRVVLLVVAAGFLFRRAFWPFTVGITLGVLGPLFWNRMESYQQARIQCFLDSSFDPKGVCWHINQSILSVGSGRVTGKGYQNATQNQLLFLPEHWTDFPFSVWAEEWGFVGAVALLALFGFVILWILNVALRAKDLFGTTICIGVASMMFWHVIVNIGMVIRLLPVVGVTLPLISYGGSSATTIFIGLGLVSSVSSRSRS
jgi:rod shape determining protein RodA